MENKAIWVGSPSGGDCIQVGSVEAHFEVDDEMDQTLMLPDLFFPNFDGLDKDDEAGEVKENPSSSETPQDGSNEDNFVYLLHAPTSGFARQNEGSLTYLNKDQQYPLMLKCPPSYAARGEGKLLPVTSLISLQFSLSELKKDNDATKSWKLWASRQVTKDLQALRVFYKAEGGPVAEVTEVARNAVSVQWYPNSNPVLVFVSVRCLSTDFTNQKGVKGIPLYLQIDTFVDGEAKERAAAQIKTFCEKGADRKNKDEARRLSSQTPPYPCQTPKENTVFSRLTDLSCQPVLFNEDISGGQPEDFVWQTRRSKTSPVSGNPAPKAKRPKMKKATRNVKVNTAPVFIHVRQENERIFTPLCIEAKNLRGIADAISKKFNVVPDEIRQISIRRFNGEDIPMTETVIEELCRMRTFFILKVLENANGNTIFSNLGNKSNCSNLYDVFFCEL